MLRRNTMKKEKTMEAIAEKKKVRPVFSMQVKEGEDKKRFSRPLEQALFVIITFLMTFFSYILIKPNVDLLPYKLFPKLIILALIVASSIGFFFYHRKKKTMDEILFFILFEAYLVHLMYMLYTDGFTRQHDVWTGKSMYGHEGYAYSFYETGKLPTHHNTPDTAYQFYHPPFNAFIQGNFMHLFENICWDVSLISDEATLYKSCQILSVFYTTLSSLFLVKCIMVTGLKPKYKLIACIFAVFYPALIVESGELNNDSLSLVFQLIALYYFLRWYLEKKSYLNILSCALAVGLALASKMSAASICLGMAVGFLIEFIRSIRGKKDALSFPQLLVQYFFFLLICAPIGLWYQVYLHVELGFPYNFVFNNLNSALYNGPRSWVIANKPNDLAYYDSNNSGVLYENTLLNYVVRFLLPFYIPDLEASIGFASSWEYHNIADFAMKTSIFGEYYYDAIIAEYIAFFAWLFLEVLWILTLVYLLYCLFHVRRIRFGKDGCIMLVFSATLILMLGYLCYKMPYGCSMDFRYIMPLILPSSYLFGKCSQTMEYERSTFNRVYRKIFLSTGALFLLSSFSFYVFAK